MISGIKHIISLSEPAGGQPMKVLVCDDEPWFCEKLADGVISWFDGHDISIECDCYSSPIQLLENADIQNAQIALLDVEMKPINGICLGEIIKEHNSDILIVYVSAYLEFAIDGYKVNAFRYLLKRDFDRTLNACMEDIWQTLSCQSIFSTKINNKVLQIHYKDIYYFESNLRKILIFGVTPQRCIGQFYGKIPALTEQLKGTGFLRTGRSYLVNMSHIKQIVNYQVYLSNGVVLSTTRTNYSEIQNQYLMWKGLF